MRRRGGVGVGDAGVGGSGGFGVVEGQGLHQNKKNFQLHYLD